MLINFHNIYVYHIMPLYTLFMYLLERGEKMFPDWESNQGPFSSQAGTQFTVPHQPGHPSLYFK